MSELKKQRKRYSLEFKQSAVKLSDRIGVVESGKKLNIPLSTLQRWRCRKKELPIEKSQDVFRLQMEVKKLKKALMEEKAIVDFLKKIK